MNTHIIKKTLLLPFAILHHCLPFSGQQKTVPVPVPVPAPNLKPADVFTQKISAFEKLGFSKQTMTTCVAVTRFIRV